VRLQDYLKRIHYDAETGVNSETLRRVHHQHLLHIPYENLSVQLKEPVGLAVEPIYDKIVEQGRGGWCYEMNGLLQWALEQIGFEVLRLSGGVLRSQRGDGALGNHLVLAVNLENRTWIADVGFGDGVREPYLLQEGKIKQGGLKYHLENLDGGYWRFHNHEFGGAANFDFRYEQADEAQLERQCLFLQSAKESPFVMSLVCQKFEKDSIEVLLGRVRRTITEKGANTRLLNSASELNSELVSVFGLDVDIHDLWPQIVKRHADVMGD
jgi:N-hydroxyarylamine O-acetyltransferase